MSQEILSDVGSDSATTGFFSGPSQSEDSEGIELSSG